MASILAEAVVRRALEALLMSDRARCWTALALASPSWMSQAMDLSRSAFMADRRVRMFLRSPAADFFQDIATPVMRPRFFSNFAALVTTALVRVFRRDVNIFLAPAIPAAAEALAAPSLAVSAAFAAVCLVLAEAMAP